MYSQNCNLILIFACSFVLLGYPQAYAKSQRQAGPKQNNLAYLRYKELVERAKKGDSAVDFVELISAASDWDLSEKEVFTAPNRETMVEAFKYKSYKKAVELAEV